MIMLEKAETDLQPQTETDNTIIPSAIKIRHAVGVGTRLTFCDGPAELGGVSEVKCSIQCLMPTPLELADIQETALRLHRRQQLNNSR